MKNFLILILLTVIVSALFCCSGNESASNVSKNALEPSLPTDVSYINLIEEVERKLESKGTKSYGSWKISEKADDKLFYFIGIDKDKTDSEILNIFDPKGKLLFRESANDFDRVFMFNILRQGRPQLIIPSINYGGSGRIFRILDYVDGKVISLNDEDEALYSGDFTILPQYQEKQYFGLPYQVLLTEYLASEDAEATILRYVDGKYVSAGKVSQRDMWIREKAAPNNTPKE